MPNHFFSLAKYKLNIDYEYDFILIGIACHEIDLKFVWQVNNKLQTEFVKVQDISIREKKNTDPVNYGIYHYLDEGIHTDFFIIVNKTGNSTLIAEQKQADYLLKISGNISVEEKYRIMKKLKEINNVIMVFDIDVEKIKAKQYLIF
mgnify:CR=1 FL=1